MNILILVFSIIALILSSAALFFAYKFYLQSKVFFGDKESKNDILKRLDDYFKETKTALDENKEINNVLNRIIEENKSNISSFITKRFNPYEESGGDLSFCVVMMNRELNGIMITSLHGRERTRIYTRNIIEGKINTELLFDEQETLKEALEKNKHTK